MTDHSVLRKGAVDAIVERELQEVRKRHPQLELGDCYAKLFADRPELYEAYVKTTAIIGGVSDD